MEDYHYRLEYILHAYVYPIIYVIGLPGNLLSFALWIHPRLRNSSACYFAAIAVFDSFLLLLHLIVTIQVVSSVEILNSTIVCEIYNVLYLSSEIMAVLLILGLTVDRYIIVHFPMRRHALCTTSRSVKVIVCLTLFAVALGVTEGSFWTYDKKTHHCITRSAGGFTGGTKRTVEVGNITILVLGILLPASLVLIFNIFIVVKLRRILAARQQMMEGREKKQDSESTILLIMLSCYLLLSEIPDSVVYLLRPFFAPPWPLPESVMSGGNRTIEQFYDKHKTRYKDYLLTAAVFGTFSLTNYAINILIYSLAGHKFRHTLMAIARKKGSVSSSYPPSQADDASNIPLGFVCTRQTSKTTTQNSQMYHSIPQTGHSKC